MRALSNPEPRAAGSAHRHWWAVAARRLWTGAALAGAAYLLFRQLSAMSLASFLHALAQTSPLAVLAAMLLTAGSYLCLSGTEWVSLRCLGFRLTYKDAVLVAVPAYALTNSAGFSPVTGTALRIELYRRHGLSTLQSTQVALLAGAAVTLSGLVSGGAVMALAPTLFSRAFTRQEGYVAAVGLALAAISSLWFVAFRPGLPAWLGGSRPARLSIRARLLALGAALGDWFLSGAAMFVLLPDASPGVFASFFVPFAAGCLLSAATGVPGGIGVFEAVVLALAGLFSQVHETAAALLLYRGIYSLGPLLLVGGYAAVSRLAGRITREASGEVEPPPARSEGSAPTASGRSNLPGSAGRPAGEPR
jgi:uncharacterized membrane protein YbhN (UPF0104 family)